MHKRHLLSNFICYTKKSSDIAFLVEHVVYSKVYSILILVFYFDLPRLIQSTCVKVNISSNFRCSAKEAMMLLCLRGTLYITFSEGIVP